MSEALNIKDLNVSYGKNKVLKNITLSIDKGKLVGTFGPNRSGKSTLVKAILELIPIDKGKRKKWMQ